MTRRAAPRPDDAGGFLPNGGSAKAGLNRSILDAGWGVFLTILAHKAESAGRELIAVNPANTSRTCARCGHCARENRVTQAEFRCTACGHQAHADVNAVNRYGVRPLSLACRNGDTGLVKLLLRAGADPNTQLPGGESVLMTAARTGRVGPVQALLDRKAAVNAKERGGQTALMWAAAEGHAEVVQLLIRAGAEFRTPLPSGFTPLCFAAREGRREVVQVLLKAGADVNQAMEPPRSGGKTPRKGTSPLLLAVENAHFELAVDLLKAGADPKATDDEGKTALDRATAKGHTQVIQLLQNTDVDARFLSAPRSMTSLPA